jgi:hypothetical protein
MKTIALLALITASALAQEVVPLDEAQRGARKVTDTLGTPSDAPFATDVDVSKPQAIRAGDGKVGLLIIPDKKLTLESLGSVGESVTPLGQLWTLNVSLGKNGEPVPNDKLRFLTVVDGDKDRQVQLYFVGAAKNSEGKLDLVVFAKDKEPVVRVPLAKSATTTTQELPIELSGRKDDDRTGTLSLRVLGQYAADLTVKRPAE